jgi:mannose-1-phosphate guanylyltransferase
VGMKAFLLAGGLGERLRPLTDQIPKCLAPINGVPLLEIWLDLLERQGIESVLLNVSRHADMVEDFMRGRNWNIDIRLVRESSPLGNAGTVLANRDFIQGEDSFFVFYADNLVDASFDKLLAFHRAHSGVLSMALFRTAQPGSAGIVDVAPDGRIRHFEEKPAHPRGNLANAGIYVARPTLLDAIPLGPFPVDFGRDAFPRLIGQMYGHVLEGYLLDIGTPAALLQGCYDWEVRMRSRDSFDVGIREAK